MVYRVTEELPISLREEVDVAWGALLRDPDVFAFSLMAKEVFIVIRRGRMERVPVQFEKSFLDGLKNIFSSSATKEMVLPDGHRLSGARSSDDELILHVEKQQQVHMGMSDLLDQEFLTEQEAVQLMSFLQEGKGVLVAGPHRVGRKMLLQALTAEAGSFFRLMDPFCQGDVVQSVPEKGAALQERIEQAYDLGADALVGYELSLTDLESLLSIPLVLPLIASVVAPSEEAIRQLSEPKMPPGEIAIVGHLPAGAPVLHLKSQVRTERESAMTSPKGDEQMTVGFEPGGGSLREAQSNAHNAAVDLPPGTADPRLFFQNAEEELPPLKPLAPGPPSGWGEEPSAELGWELDSKFAKTLAAVERRPKFHPSPPPAHPQAHSLKEKPFGGLTLEPPPDLKSNSSLEENAEDQGKK